MLRRLLPLAGLALLAGCNAQNGDGPLVVSVIGDRPALVDPNIRTLDSGDALLLGNVAQGLVRFDSEGQIEPGIALRWGVSTDGLFYTFRLNDEASLDARAVARRLRAILAKSSRNSLKPALAAIDEVVAVTPQVVELRLKYPRPDLLELLAQPELALLDTRPLTGPLQPRERQAEALRLTLLQPKDSEAAAQPPGLILRGESAARAVARFSRNQSRLVLGGRLADLPLLQAAKLRQEVIRFDEVVGLFALAPRHNDGLLGNAGFRRALAMALDRERIGPVFGSVPWQPSLAPLSWPTLELPNPPLPGWAGLALGERRLQARALVALALSDAKRTGPVKLRLWLPAGSGSTVLFRAVRADWQAIGVELSRVERVSEADLTLIDVVAPSGSASWGFGLLGCTARPACDPTTDTAASAAFAVPDAGARAAALGDAAMKLNQAMPVIPLAQPLRWSLVAPNLAGFQPNARGVHPLYPLLQAGRK
jgi:oligopeptide transport system substrate-binding protein